LLRRTGELIGRAQFLHTVVHQAFKVVLVYIFSQFWTLEPDLSLQIAPGQGHCFVG
jgi:hypothetical protein